MASIVMTASDEFTVKLTPIEARIVSDLGVSAKNDVENYITEFLKTKEHERLHKRNRNIMNKLLSVNSSTQQQVIDLLFST